MTTTAEIVEPGSEPVDEPETGTTPDEGGDTGDEPEDRQEPGDEATAAVSDREIQSAMDKLAREEERHAKRVGDIMGEDALVLVKCELCAPGIPGFRFPVQPDDETTQAVRKAIGDAPPEDYKQSPDADVCEACGGLGRQLTGSLVPEHRTKPCSRCLGAGWLDKTQAPTAPTPQSLDVGRAPIAETFPADVPEVDPWGRARGDALYGVMPGYEAGR